MLLLPTRIVKFGVLVILKCYCDQDVKGFGHFNIVSSAKIILLFCVTCSNWFYDLKRLASELQNSSHLLVRIAIDHYRYLV